MREAMSAALREGRIRHVRSKSEDDLEERLGTVSAEMVAAAKAVVVVKDGDNEGEEMPALRIEVFLKSLVKLFEEEDVFKCTEEALDAVEETIEKEAFGEPRALTVRRLAKKKSCAEYEAWMAGDKRKENHKSPSAARTQSASPIPPAARDLEEEEEDEVRSTRFTHLIELAWFQELVQRGLTTKKVAKPAIETMDEDTAVRWLHSNSSGGFYSRFVIRFLQQICDKAASLEKRPQPWEVIDSMYLTVRRVSETCLWDEFIESVNRKMIDAIEHKSLRPIGDSAVETSEKDALDALNEQLFEDEGIIKAMAQVDERDRFRALPRLSTLLGALGETFDRKVVKKCVDAAMEELEDAMERDMFGPGKRKKKTMAMRAAALRKKGGREEGGKGEGTGDELAGKRGGGRGGGGAAAGKGRGAGGRKGEKQVAVSMHNDTESWAIAAVESIDSDCDEPGTCCVD